MNIDDENVFNLQKENEILNLKNKVLEEGLCQTNKSIYSCLAMLKKLKKEKKAIEKKLLEKNEEQELFE